MRKLWRIFLVIGCISTVISGGCSERGNPLPMASGSADGDVSPGADGAAACAGSVTGQVRFPNGLMTVPNALVYVTAPGRDVERSGECMQCLGMDGVMASVTTGVDGVFTLRGVPPGDYDLVVEKGLFQRRVSVTVGCEELALSPREVSLPGSADEGRIPRIAVIQGAHDFMEGVLAKLGLGEMTSDGSITRRAFDLFPVVGVAPDPSVSGSDARTRAFLRDGDQLGSYDYVFVNCGSGLEGYDTMDIGETPPTGLPGGSVPGGGVEDPPGIFEDATVRENLRAFVAGGGRLYVTDQSYDFIEQTYPGAIDFFGGSEDGLAATPEVINAAEEGEDTMLVQGRVHDDSLRRWLDLHGMVDDSGTVPIRNLVGGWAPVTGLDDGVTTWVTGSIGTRTDIPLTVSFEAGCGRVLFTSYHTHHTEGGPHSDQMNAQEMILGYLAFEIGTCVEDPILI